MLIVILYFSLCCTFNSCFYGRQLDRYHVYMNDGSTLEMDAAANGQSINHSNRPTVLKDIYHLINFPRVTDARTITNIKQYVLVHSAIY